MKKALKQRTLTLHKLRADDEARAYDAKFNAAGDGPGELGGSVQVGSLKTAIESLRPKQQIESKSVTDPPIWSEK